MSREFKPASLRCRVRRSDQLPGRRTLEATATFEPLEQRALLAVDPITPNHPLWTALDAANVRIDGQLKEPAWSRAQPIIRTQAYTPDSRVSVRMLHTRKGLALGVEVRDDRLWADGLGGGSGDRWVFYHDDAIAFFFDPRNTRRRILPASGRMFAFNIGGMTAPANGPGAVGRWELLKGDGKGTGTLVFPHDTLPAGMKWSVRLNGTVNDNSDTDFGWTAEALLPWSVFGFTSRPQNGFSMGMNFEVFFDDNGGTRQPADVGNDPDPLKRLGPRITDDHLNAVFSSFNQTDTGWKGPINYANLQFEMRSAPDRPAAIVDLAASATTGYGTRLDFTAPAGSSTGRGHASGYEIRWSATPFAGEEDWASATIVENTFVARPRGVRESLRIGGLEPDTEYHIGVRAKDASGRLGDIASVSVRTQTADEDPSGGGRIIVSPNGGTLMYEDGRPFVMIGGTVGVGNLYVRSLYSGLLYRPGDGAFVNFSNGVPEGTAAGYFDSLAEYGVNTLRVQLEWARLEMAGRSRLPEGFRWLEWRQPGDSQSTFNENMKLFLHRMMEQADRTGIRLFLQTFNNFNYRSSFELTPFARVNGGPLDSMDDFYFNPEVLEMCKVRMSTLAQWVRESPHAHTIIGFELLNEWDGYDTSRDLNVEWRQRAMFHVALSQHLRSVAPELNVMSSSINLAPRGPVGRILYYSGAFDILDPHFYTSSTAEPVFNPDADKSVRPAADYGALSAYWLSNRRDFRPVHNAEWGLEPRTWPGKEIYYTDFPDTRPAGKPRFLLREDEAIYRTTSWVTLASGLAGSGLRIGHTTLADTWGKNPTPDTSGYLPLPLSRNMREVQRTIRAFTDESTLGFDWAGFQAVNLSGRISAAGTGGDTLRAWGSADADQGLAYVLRDAARSRGDAQVSGARLRIDGLRAGAVYNVEFWSTGSNGQVIGTLSGAVATAGSTFWAIPAFVTDVAVKFVRVG